MEKSAAAGTTRGWGDVFGFGVRKRARRSDGPSLLTQVRALAPALLVMAALGAALIFAASSIPKNLVHRWSDNDVTSRSRLIDRSIEQPLAQALNEHDARKVKALFVDVARDERVLALGLCDPAGRLRSPTDGMPRGFTCLADARADGF